MHAKAKLIILQFVGMILNDQHKINIDGSEVQFDAQLTSVTQIFKMLNHYLSTDFDVRPKEEENKGFKK